MKLKPTETEAIKAEEVLNVHPISVEYDYTIHYIYFTRMYIGK